MHKAIIMKLLANQRRIERAQALLRTAQTSDIDHPIVVRRLSVVGPTAGENSASA